MAITELLLNALTVQFGVCLEMGLRISLCSISTPFILPLLDTKLTL